jgi:glycerol-3-phosphate O-acyltransferase / dihydroxyacetone phosphate acyltransferase
LVAASSMQMRVIGFLARLVSSIPVARAQDYAKTGTGRIYLDEKDPCLIHGEGTSFTTELEPRKQIVLPKSVNSVAAEVAEVVSNTEVRLKREFSDDTGSMTERVREVMNTTDGYGFEFKVLPHLDQADMYRYVHSSLSTGGLIGIFPEGEFRFNERYSIGLIGLHLRRQP